MLPILPQRSVCLTSKVNAKLFPSTACHLHLKSQQAWVRVVIVTSLPKHGGMRQASKWLAVISILLLGTACVFLYARLYFNSAALLLAAEVSAFASLDAGLAALFLFVSFVYLTRPGFRAAVVFLVILTSAVFAEHLYIINSPPTATPSSVSGAVGSRVDNGDVTLTSHLTGGTLSLSVADSGQSAVEIVQVQYGGGLLPASGLVRPPSPESPLLPQQVTRSFGGRYSVNGSWQVGSGGTGLVNVTYDRMDCYHLPDNGNGIASFGCVMDEAYYLAPAQRMLNGTQCAPGASGCNEEHPPLGKAMMAAGMAIFGVNDFGWRIPIAVLGTLSIPLLFGLVYLLSRSIKLAAFSSLLLAADNLFFVHSSIGVIDVPSVFFGIAAFVVYFWKGSFWRINNYVASGALLGLALLSKETAVFMLAGLLTYHLFASRQPLKQVALVLLEILVAASAVFAAGLQLYAFAFTYSSAPFFYQLVQYMLKYGVGLTGTGWTGGLGGGYITPLDWITFYTPVAYLVTRTGNLVDVGYWGTANVIIVWMLFFWVPLVVYRLVRRPQPGEARDLEDSAGAFALVWFLWTYVPYIFLWLYGRVTYPFYLVPAIPALAIGAAYFVTRKWFPTLVACVYLAAALGWFFLYFPLKDFLPDWVRTALGR
jgi:dolichyl-phosphate-mannose-protein mannosyltransferase